MSGDQGELQVAASVRRGGFALAAEFRVPLSGIVTVFGPSGAGKSMLLSMLAGLSRLESGQVVLAGRVLEDVGTGVRVAPHERDIGLVFQDARLFPHLTVRGNLAYAAKRAPAGRAVLSVGAAAERLECGGLLDRPVRNLSGGEKSRVALARALLSAPSLLLLDEPFAALDGRRRRDFIAMLVELNASSGLPMMVVTHVIEDAVELGEHVVALQAGGTVAAGRADEVMRTPEFLALLDRRDVGARIAASAIAGDREARGRGVWVRADNVLVASEAPRGLSARNVWAGTVASIVREPDGSALVGLEAQVGVVLARITPEAVGELGLGVGKAAWAVVKTHAV